MTRQAEMEKMWPGLPPFCQRHARHHGSSLQSTACPSGIRSSHSFRSAPAALPPPASHAAPFAFRLSSPVIARAAWAAYAEGVVPPLLRRAPHSTGDQRGARGCRGSGAAQAPPPCRLAALDPARMPGNGRHPTAISQSASGSIPRQRPPKNAKGAGPPEEDRPLCKIGLSTGSRWFHQLPAAQLLKEEEPLVHDGEHGHGE